jgi:hypothetical protein
MNLQDTLPLPGATHGVFSTLNEPLNAGMLVVVVDVVAVDVVVVVDVVAVDVVVVVVVGGALVVVVVLRSGLVPLSPQPRAARTRTAIVAARPFGHGMPLRLSRLIMLSSAACVL